MERGAPISPWGMRLSRRINEDGSVLFVLYDLPLSTPDSLVVLHIGCKQVV